MAEYPSYEDNLPYIGNDTWYSGEVSKYSFMEGFMTLGEKTVKAMFPAYGEFSGFTFNSEDILNFDDVDIDDITWKNTKPLAFIVLGIIYAILMLIVGFIWCLCSMCCSKKLKKKRDSRGRERYDGLNDEGGNTCWSVITKVIMGILLVLFGVIIISGFSMNAHFNNAVDDLPNDVNNTINDAELYLSYTKEQIQAVYKTSYQNLSHKVTTMIEESIPSLPRISDDQLTKLETGIKDINQKLNSLESQPFENDGDLLRKYLTEFSSITEDMEDLQSLSIFKDAPAIYQISGSHPRSEELEYIKAQVGVVGTNLEEISNSLINALNEIDLSQIREDITKVEDEVENVKPIVYGSLLAVWLILLAIMLLFVVGSIMVCAMRKRSRDKGCCRPSFFLKSGMCAVFLAGFILMCFSLVLFVFSGFVQMFCTHIRSLENIDNSSTTVRPFSPFKMLQMLPTRHRQVQDGEYELPSYESIIESCKQEKSAYQTFKLEQIYDINEILNLTGNFTTNFFRDSVETYNIKTSIDEVSKEMKQFMSVDIKDPAHFKTNVKKFGEMTNKIMTDLEKSQQEIHSEISGDTPKAKDIIDDVLSQIENYGKFVHHQTLNEVGRCDPMYQALDTTLDVFCYKIAYPVVGFWMTLAFLLLLFVPLLIFTVFLSNSN